MPPNEKTLCEILKEEKISPTKRYAKKFQPKYSFIKKLKMDFRVVTIPFIIPWEQTASLQTQNGMNAFGAIRDPNIHINEGQIKLIQVIIINLQNSYKIIGSFKIRNLIAIVRRKHKISSITKRSNVVWSSSKKCE